MNGYNVLVVDDDKAIVEAIEIYLKGEGYNIFKAYDGAESLDVIREEEIHLVIMDIMMPKMDGTRATLKIREEKEIPIIMLSAKSEDTDKILGLNIGADDYVTKPFNPLELIARVKANLRRSVAGVENTKKSVNVLDFGKLQIDLDKFEARKQDKVLELTFREFELLKFLAQNMTQVFSRETLLEKVWGYEYYGDVRTVDVTVRRLREKLEDNPGKPEYILTKRGVGYYFGGN